MIDQTEYENLLSSTQKECNGRARTDLDAYLAGFFDGEGSISTSRDPRRPYCCYVSINVTNTDLVPLRLFVRAYGGSICKKTKAKNNVKDCYAWRCYNGKDALWALCRMLPWLTVKRKRARTAIIVLQNRPLRASGGQISAYQKAAITKALDNQFVMEVDTRWVPDKNPNPVLDAPVIPMEQTSAK